MFLKHGIFNFTNEHINILNDLSKLNSDYTKKINDYFLVKNQYNSIEIHCIDEDGIETAFSINNCITGKGRTLLSKISTNFRDCVNDQILEFKNKNNWKYAKCSLCKSRDKIEVDHMTPTFRKMTYDFLDKNGLEGKFEITKEICDKFAQYHREVATLRFLCQKCNAEYAHTKGRKKIIPDDEIKEYKRNWFKLRYIEKKKSPAKQKFEQIETLDKLTTIQCESANCDNENSFCICPVCTL
jgi:hypothetical protein